MNLEQFSLIISIGLSGLFIVSVVSMVSFLFSKKARAYFKTQDYFLYIKAVGVLAITATVGALIYQFTYKTPVCEYCWWQRIFMFPIDIIVAVTLWKNIKHNELVIAILAGLGAVFAGVHYYFHVQVAVLGNIMSLPCSSIGIIPSCTETPVLIWGFVTIPLMALVVFLSILWLCFLAHYSNKSDKV